MKIQERATTSIPSPDQVRSIIGAARRSGRLAYLDLDELLLDAAEREDGLSDLVTRLDGVVLYASSDEREPLNDSIGPIHLVGDDFRLYADQVRALPRLGREEEHTLARRLEFTRARMARIVDGFDLPAKSRDLLLERGINCESLHDDIRELGLDVEHIDVPCESEDPVVRNIVTEYARLRGHMVERNLYLVIGMTAAYRTYGLPVMDLIQEGNASLIRAVEKFDWRKGVRFQTYAAWWVRQAVERLITANRGIVRVPNYIQQKMRRLRREGKLPRNHKDMDVRDVSTLFDTTVEAAARLMETDRPSYSLDAPMGEDDTFASILEAEGEDNAMAAAEKRALCERLDQVLTENLTAQEREILIKRFGLGGAQPATLDQIGTAMGVSRERIRQMQVRALDKLQKRRLLDELRDYL